MLLLGEFFHTSVINLHLRKPQLLQRRVMCILMAVSGCDASSRATVRRLRLSIQMLLVSLR